MATEIDIREWRKLKYLDTAPLIQNFVDYARGVDWRVVPPNVAGFRTAKLKRWHELRLGAIYFFLMGQVENKRVLFSHVEAKDYDFVGYYRERNVETFIPTQMKELVPHDVNESADFQALIDGIRAKYVTSTDLTVAVALNRECTLRFQDIDFSGLNIKGLWVFGSGDPTRRTWTVIGNLIQANWQSRDFVVPL